MGSSLPSNEVDNKNIGVQYVENQYWKMVRQGKTKSLTQAFKQQMVDCFQVIVPKSGHTIVHESIILNRREHFKLCQIYGANWDHQDFNGVTPLMKAVALNRIFYVQRLIELGADKNLKDNNGRTVYDYGKMYENYDCLDLLQLQ